MLIGVPNFVLIFAHDDPFVFLHRYRPEPEEMLGDLGALGDALTGVGTSEMGPHDGCCLEKKTQFSDPNL